MLIKLQNAGKRYSSNWVIRNLTQEFKPCVKCAITGPNGSGKSTLLKIISGSLTLSEGNINYSEGAAQFSVEKIYNQISICAPYLDLPEEYSLPELLAFHIKFKKLSLPLNEVIRRLELKFTENRQLKYYSSGMKQRVKLGIAIMSDVPILLLDEPCTALDADAIKWYQQLISDFALNKTILVFSNKRTEEYSFCDNTLNPFNRET